MRLLSGIFALILALIPVAATAQDDDRGYLQAWLEDNLSDAGRDIRLIGFEGALSARAKIDELTIADDDGIWLTLRDAVLDWDRKALLKGELKVRELSAKELLLPRQPNPQPLAPDTGVAAVALPDAPAPEAKPFELPELPVSIRVDELKIDRVVIGEAVFGTAAELEISGQANLSGGEGSADLSVVRTDGPRGEFTLEGSFSNSSRELAIDALFVEEAGGLVSAMTGLPGAPAINWHVRGEGPMSGFEATTRLTTNGTERLSGTFTLSGMPDQQGHTFGAELGGDLRPLFKQKYHDFFGASTELSLAGDALSDGSFRLSRLKLRSQEVDLEGALDLAPDGWPDRFNLQGQLAAQDGGDILLALPGEETWVSRAHVDLAYDADKGDKWQADINIDKLRQAKQSLAQASLTGSGTIQRGAVNSLSQANGDLAILLDGIQLADATLSQTIGNTLRGDISFFLREESGALNLPRLSLAGADYGLDGTLVIAGVNDLEALSATGDIALEAETLARFADISGLSSLNGSASLNIKGRVDPLDQMFDLSLSGQTRDLQTGIKELDPLLSGPAVVSLKTARDTEGLRLAPLSITTQQASIFGDLNLTSKDSKGKIDIGVMDTALIDPKLSGPAKLSARFEQDLLDWNITADLSGPGGATANIAAIANVAEDVVGQVKGTIKANVETLTPYSGLVGQSLSGGLSVDADLDADLVEGSGMSELSVRASSLGTGIASVDKLLHGQSSADVKLTRDASGRLTIQTGQITTPELRTEVSGNVSSRDGQMLFDTTLRDIGIFVDNFSGPVSAKGTAGPSGDNWALNLSATGPGGVQAQLGGDIAKDASQAHLELNGTGPLALANNFIRPNLATGLGQFDLKLNGPIDLNAISGTVTTSGGGLSLPRQKLALEDLAARAQVNAGKARLDISSRLSTGGTLRVTGPIDLNAPYQGSLAVQLDRLGLVEPGLYETTLNGALIVEGPMQGGASVAGDMTLGTVELRVPSTFGESGGALPGLVHQNEPSKTRETRTRAGLLNASKTNSSGGTKAYPLDVGVNAPSKIFVRGRGLDAELGGALRVTGTTSNVVPQGQFSLIRGRLDILGKRLDLTEGTIQLEGDFDPYLRFVAETNTGDTDVRFTLEGPASKPEVTITSSPELPQDEILARMLFGRDLTEISAVQAIQIASAIKVLSGGTSTSERLRDKIGLDDLNLETNEDGTTGVSAGKYISENVYSDVTATSDGKTEINLNLQISPSLTARGSVDSTGNSGIGLYFEKDY